MRTRSMAELPPSDWFQSFVSWQQRPIFLRTTALRKIQFAARMYFECLCSGTFCKDYTMTHEAINKKYDKFDVTPKQFIGLVISLVSNEIRLCCGGKKNIANQRLRPLKLYILTLSGVLQLQVVVSLVLCRCPLNRGCPNWQNLFHSS